LRGLHHRVVHTICGSGEEALEIFGQAGAFTAVIIDLALPGMDGWTLLKQLRSLSNTLPCAAITAYHSPELAVKAIEAGFTVYFPKPLDLTSFMRELERSLASH